MAVTDQILHNTAGKIYYVVPSLIGTGYNASQITTGATLGAASTSVLCPMKPLSDHNGFSSYTGSGDTSTLKGVKPYFSEIVGVVPTKIYVYETGGEIFINQSTIKTYIKEINYRYLDNGGKVISIVYNQDSIVGTDNLLREIEFKILFDGGDYHTVKQPIVNGVCLSASRGTVFNYSQAFNFEELEDYLPNGFSNNSKKDKALGGLSIQNIGFGKNVVGFNTFAYTDPKWADQSLLLGSSSNRDFFEICPLFDHQDFDYGASEPVTFTVEPYGTGGSEDVTVTTNKVHYEFRQTSRAEYGGDNVGVSEGSFNRGYINPLQDIYFTKQDLSLSRFANYCYYSLDWTALHIKAVTLAGNIQQPVDGDTPPGPLQINTVKGASLDGSLSTYPAGWFGTTVGTDGTQGYGREKSSAFHVRNTAGNKQHDYSTARRFDGVAWSISKKWTGTFTEPEFNASSGFDTVNGFLRNIVSFLEKFAENEANYNSSSWSQGNFAGKGSLKTHGDTDSPTGLINLGMMHPGDYIANFILGNHSHFLSRPSNADTPEQEQTPWQTMLTAAVFGKTSNGYSPAGSSINDFIAVGNTNGLNIDPLNAEYGGYVILACPYHVYIDSFQAFEGTDVCTPINSYVKLEENDTYDYLLFSEAQITTAQGNLDFEKYYFGEDTSTKYIFKLDTSSAARIGDGGDLVREQSRLLAHSGGVAIAHSSAGVYFSNGVGTSSTYMIGDNSTAQYASPTLDRNTTYFNGEVTSPNADGELEILPAWAGNFSGLEYTPSVNSLDALHIIPQVMESSSFYTQKAVLCNSSFAQSVSPSERRSFARGCIPFEREVDPGATNIFEVRVITGTGSMFSGTNVSELEFNFPYKIGTSLYLPDSGLDYAGWAQYAFNENVTGTAGTLNCGCGGSADNFQYTAFGAATNVAATSSTGNDIFDIRYTPGRNLLDPELFPVNNNEFSTAFVSTVSGNGQPDSSASTMRYTSRLTADNPQDTDRLFTDVSVDSFDWGPNALYISTVDIAAAADDADGNYTNVQRGVISIANSGYQDGTKSIDVNVQRFQFVGIGEQLVEGGGVLDDIAGCTDDGSFNYDPAATVDDGTCAECVEGNIGAIAGSLNDQATIFPNLGVTGNSQPFGMSSYYNNTNYQGGVWHQGQIGNAFNHWGFGLQEAVDYSAGSEGIVIPFGEAWETANPGTDPAAPFTEFVFKTNLISGDLGVNGADPSFQTWLSDNLSNIDPEGVTLRIYNIDDWQGGDGDWAQVYDESPGNILNNPTPLTNYSSPILIMTNQSQVSTDVVFATYDYNLHGDNPDYNSESFDILTDTYFQDKLKAGKHYVAVLEVEADTYLDAGGSCRITKTVPFNFWVMFCGCDVYNSPTYIGNFFSDLPWWENATFPAGYSLISQCSSEAQSRRIAKSPELQDGYCAPIPDPFTCDNFIDACVNNSTFDCVYTEGESEGIVIGTIGVDVYGAYTNAQDGIDNYAFELGGELFTFDVYLIEGEWSGTGTPSEYVEVISISSAADYADYSIDPYNAADGPLHHEFPIQGGGVYSIVLVQTNQFSFQDFICPPILIGETTITAQVNGETECPERIIGCQDPQAINTDCACGNEDYTNGGCADGVTVSADPSCCIYVDCNDVYLDGRIEEITTVNTTQNCVQINDEGVLVNTLVDTFTGSITVEAYDATVSGGTVTGTFVMCVMGIVDGQASVAVDTILGVIEGQNDQVYDTTRTEPIEVIAGNTTLGYILGFDNNGDPLLTQEDLAAGNYVVMMVNNYVADIDETCVGVGFVDNFDSINFANVGATVDYTDCPSPCNDTDNPEDCPDIVGGCTDENASNYDPNADYNDGTCDYSDSDPCDQGQDADGCEDCESAAAAGLNTRRNCDEFNETTEGCCNPLACNYDPTVDVCLESRCEFCCDGTEDCSDEGVTDECEDQDGNLLPDCITPECPDPNNPDCDVVVVDPCPNGDCGGPPDPTCVLLGNCPQGGGGGGGDPTVVIDDPIVNEVYCEPNFGTSSNFGEVQRAAMTCSANEGSKLLFKLRSGVKYDRTDLIKLELINYLFNNSMVNPCMSTCEDTQDNRALDKGINRLSCRESWARTGKEYWAQSSTYSKGTVVALLSNVLGTIHRQYFRATRNVNAGELRPDASVGNLKTTGWTPCVEFRGVKSQTGEEPYAYKLYEFMIKYCEQCSIYSQGAESMPRTGKSTQAAKPGDITGLIDNEGNVIKLF